MTMVHVTCWHVMGGECHGGRDVACVGERMWTAGMRGTGTGGWASWSRWGQAGGEGA